MMIRVLRQARLSPDDVATRVASGRSGVDTRTPFSGEAAKGGKREEANVLMGASFAAAGTHE